MKKIILSLIALFLMVSCEKESNNLKISFKIDNPTSDTLTIMNEEQEVMKTLVAKEKGVFTDTLNIETGLYLFQYNQEFGSLFLKNGHNLQVSLDTKQFDETIKFIGKGEKENNFIVSITLKDEKYDFAGLMKNEEKIFLEKITALQDEKIKSLEDTGLDKDFVSSYKKYIEKDIDGIKKYYEENLKMFESNGAIAFDFNYENYKGGSTRLSSLKGKYVYIDIWATWCGPCLQEIPFLQEVEKKYHGKNIEFVSISIDEMDKKIKWKEMVATRNMGGIQLIADKAWESEICTSLSVTGIPRFVLIDTEGKILNANAPRPSDQELITILDGLKL